MHKSSNGIAIVKPNGGLFTEAKRLALENIDSIFRENFPAAKLIAGEYVMGNKNGDKGSSLGVNQRTGLWRDRQNDTDRGNLLELLAYRWNMDDADAAQEIHRLYGNVLPVRSSIKSRQVAKSAGPEDWTPLPFGPPCTPPAEMFVHIDDKGRSVKPHNVWEYTTATGETAGFIYRYDIAPKNKQFRQYSFCRNGDGVEKWMWKGLAEPIPLYRLPELMDSSLAVLIVEGEKAHDAALKVLGNHYAVTCWAGGTSAVGKTDFSTVTGRNVVIWPDNDEGGIKAAEKIAAITGGIIVYPPADWPKKHDIADFVEAGKTTEEILELIHQNSRRPVNSDDVPDDILDAPAKSDPWNDPKSVATRLTELARVDQNHALEFTAKKAEGILAGASKKFPITKASDLEGVEIHMPNPLIHGILREGEVMLLAGESKVGKTWLVLGLAYSIATGTPWLGVNCVQGGVGYFNFEIDARVMSVRAQLVCKDSRRGIFPEALSFINLRGERADIPALTPMMVDSAKTHDWKVIIIDALYNALGDRAENDNGEMAELMHELTQLSVATGCAVIVVHHFNKASHGKNESSASAANQMSGAGSLMRAPETVLTITRIHADGVQKYGLDDTLMNMKVEASLRTFRELKTFAISRHPETCEFKRYDADLIGLDKKAAKDKKAKVGHPAKEVDTDAICDAIPDSGFRTREFIAWLMTEHGMSQSAAYRFKADAVSGKSLVYHAGNIFRGQTERF